MKKIFAMVLIVAAVGLYAVPTFTIAKSTNVDDEILTINDERQAVSDGRMFFATNSFLTTSQGYYILTGGINPRLSVSIMALTTDSVYSTSMEFYEGASMAESTGTAMTVYNLNRESSTDPTMKISHSPTTLTTSTTQLPTLQIPLRQDVPREYCNPTLATGWILKKRTAYYIKITPSSPAANGMYVRFSWKE